MGPEKNRVRRNHTVEGLHYGKTQKNHAGARNGTNISVDANFLVPKPKSHWSKTRDRQNRIRRGVSVAIKAAVRLDWVMLN